MGNEREMRPAVIAWLRATGHPNHCFESSFGHGYVDIVGFRFAEQTSRRIPPLEAVAVVELKLSKIAEVIRQALNNRTFIAASWCAMQTAFVASMRPQTLDKFKDAGVGLLAVDGLEVKTIVLPLGTLRNVHPEDEPHYRKYITKRMPARLWRRRFEESTE